MRLLNNLLNKQKERPQDKDYMAKLVKKKVAGGQVKSKIKKFFLMKLCVEPNEFLRHLKLSNIRITACTICLYYCSYVRPSQITTQMQASFVIGVMLFSEHNFKL